MFAGLLITIGLVFIAITAVLVHNSDPNGYSLLLIAIVFLFFGGLAYDIQHPKARYTDAEDIPKRRVKRRRARVG